VLIARIYEVFPLLCSKYGGHMRLIASITAGTQIRRFLDHIRADPMRDTTLEENTPMHILRSLGPRMKRRASHID
jgi:hypothetical protein